MNLVRWSTVWPWYWWCTVWPLGRWCTVLYVLHHHDAGTVDALYNCGAGEVQYCMTMALVVYCLTLVHVMYCMTLVMYRLTLVMSCLIVVMYCMSLVMYSVTLVQVCEDLMMQRPPDYGGMKIFLKKTYDRVERWPFCTGYYSKLSIQKKSFKPFFQQGETFLLFYW